MNDLPVKSGSDDLANKKSDNSVRGWGEVSTEAQLKADQLQSVQHTSLFTCRECDKNFSVYCQFKIHLLKHVQLPQIIVQRLNPSYVRRITSNKPLRSGQKGRKHNFARKRIRSYIVPKVNKKVQSLKLTLKLASDATTEKPSFEVVPRKILIGPAGEQFSTNGEVLDEVKTEVITQGEDVEWNNTSVEGEGEKEREQEERNSESTLGLSENSGVNNVEGVGQVEGEEGVGEEEEEEELTEDNFQGETQRENSRSLADLDQGLRSACPSPTPSEQLRPEFLAPGAGDEEEEEEEEDEEEEEEEGEEGGGGGSGGEEEENCDNSEANMVEGSGSGLPEAGSPAFPTTSPAPPPSGDSNSQHSLSDRNQQISPSGITGDDRLNQPENGDSHSSNHGNSDETTLPSETGNFNWNDVGNVSAANIDDAGTSAESLDERDPLMLPEQTSTEPGHENESVNSSDSLLRGFLCDPSGGDKAIAVTTPSSGVGNVMDGLGSEYISLERLGETGALARCDVCGEQTSNLEEHRVRAGHYKCSHPECATSVFATANELTAHQHVTHGGPPPSAQQPQTSPQPQQPHPQAPQQYPMHHQPPPPVQQLAQQVQRLPIPPQQLSPHQMNHQPQQQMVQQMSPQLHQLMPPQQQYPQSPVRRPPPLYRVPGSANMPGTPPGVQYPNQPQQHMMSPQMYNQQPYPQSQNNYPNPAGSLTPPRPYGNMVQQMGRPRAPSQHSMQRPTMIQQQPQPRMGIQQKRPALVSNSPGSSPNKQRRMDVLIPDRHDDADCHVIAMQKRTDSGPVIGNVQGAANSARPESMIHLTDSITLSVRQPQGGSNVAQVTSVGGKNKSDAKAVANILATRGITVTPAGGTGGRTGAQQPAPQQRQSRPVQQVQTAQPAQPVTTLNLNSAISIIAQPTAAARQQQQQGNFVVPPGRGSVSRQQQQQQVERPPRPPTVDLTGDGPPPPLMHTISRGRGRGRGIMGRHTCHVCDKAFSTQESLNQHMALHRSPGKLPYRCTLCTAQYPTQQGLLHHRQTFHKEPSIQAGAELAIPVVDLKAPGSLNRLAGLGIHHYIPLSQLGSQAGGYIGLPIVSVEGARNSGICNLSALGAASVLSLGPIKQLGR